jgi:hypothetical protein
MLPACRMTLILQPYPVLIVYKVIPPILLEAQWDAEVTTTQLTQPHSINDQGVIRYQMMFGYMSLTTKAMHEMPCNDIMQHLSTPPCGSSACLTAAPPCLAMLAVAA